MNSTSSTLRHGPDLDLVETVSSRPRALSYESPTPRRKARPSAFDLRRGNPCSSGGISLIPSSGNTPSRTHEAAEPEGIAGTRKPDFG